MTLPLPGRKVPVFARNVGIVPVERERPPNHLNHFGIEYRRELRGGFLRRDLGILPDLQFHQFLRAQRVVRRLPHRGRKALLANVHEWIEMMRLGAQRRALLAGEAQFASPAFAKLPNGFTGGPSHHCLLEIIRMTWKWRCGTVFCASPVVPT